MWVLDREGGLSSYQVPPTSLRLFSEPRRNPKVPLSEGVMTETNDGPFRLLPPLHPLPLLEQRKEKEGVTGRPTRRSNSTFGRGLVGRPTLRGGGRVEVRITDPGTLIPRRVRLPGGPGSAGCRQERDWGFRPYT